MNDNTDKILIQKNLEDSELEQVSGGIGKSSKGGKDVPIRYCKYCDKDTTQIYKGRGRGYMNGDPYNCKLWECTICHNTNYWTTICKQEVLLI